MKILLTNDDGFDALGIDILYKQLQKYGEVTLVAPKTHMSGMSMSRHFWNQIEVKEIEKNKYTVDGTPADAVVMALYGLNIQPDLVVSGINNGYNLSTDTTYSGTIGAAMEATKIGIPAIAFSSDNRGFSNAEKDLDYVMNYILNKKLLSKDYLLNVNFTKQSTEKTKGIMITDIGRRPESYFYERDGDLYKSRFKVVDYEPTKGTDLYAIRNGYISITPLKFGYSTIKGLKELKEKIVKKD